MVRFPLLDPALAAVASNLQSIPMSLHVNDTPVFTGGPRNTCFPDKNRQNIIPLPDE